MKKLILFLFVLSPVLLNISFASPKISFNELMVQSELNPQFVLSARNQTMEQNLPVNIVSMDNIMADVKSIENGKPVYLVITNFANPYDGGYAAFFEEINSKIDFSRSRIDFGKAVVDNTGGYFTPLLSSNRGLSKVLMIPEWTSDRIFIFNPENGNLIDTAFTPTSRPQLASPKHALQHFNGKDIILADQITDLIQRFNPNGTYQGIFAPIGGPITTIVDNMRGIKYRPNLNLLATVGSGANQNTIQQFDSGGVHIGTFITGNLNSPFDILIRQNDILITNSSAPNDITRFDLNGIFLNNFYVNTNLAFPQQMHQLSNDIIAVAGFSSPSGIIIMDSNGTYKKTLNGVTGNRGVYLLGNGNYLTTNGGGVHEIDSATGSLVRTVVPGLANFQYISEYEYPNPSLRITINLESCVLRDTIVVELRDSITPFNIVDSKAVVAGLGIPSVVEFTNVVNDIPYYMTVKYKNSIATWSAGTLKFNSNYLNYNFTFANSQSFGNNMINVGGKWSFYQGDIDQNEFVDLADVLIVYDGASIFTTGYALTDINCDNIVDLSDILVASNNSSSFIGVIKP